MPRPVRRLPGKHEDLSLVPRAHILKRQLYLAHAYIPNAGKAKTDSLGLTGQPQVSGASCLTKQAGQLPRNDARKQLQAHTCLCITHTHMPTLRYSEIYYL